MKVVCKSLLAFAFLLCFSFAAQAATDCVFTVVETEMTLTANCMTNQTLLIPNGFTVDLNGKTVSVFDPPGGHFVGAVFKNAGAEASITNGTVLGRLTMNVCDGGDDRLRGVLFQGASGSITNLRVLSILQPGNSGCQEGNSIEVRNFGHSERTTRVTVDGNVIQGYQKTGIIANGDVFVTATNNEVSGGPAVGFIAKNGIQFGFGASGMAKRNLVRGNSYTGSSAVSGGILVVGGPGYGPGLAFCVGVQIMNNDIQQADVGVYISQYNADFTAPNTATNIKVVGNVITKFGVTNGFVYQAGISDVGNNDKIINNEITGEGYNPLTLPGSTFEIDAEPSFTNRAKVHANE